MNWEIVGAAAEIAGAIGVLVTLVYLAIQTRDNTRVQRSRAVWDAQTSFVEVNDLLSEDGTIGKVIYKAMSEPDSLSDYELYLIHRFSRGWFQRMEAQFALYKSGILDEELWQLRCGYARAMLSVSPFREWWQLDKHNSMFTSDFIATMEMPDATQTQVFMGVDNK